MTGSSQTGFAGGGNSIREGAITVPLETPKKEVSEGLQLMKLETLAGSLEMTQSLMGR